MRNRFLYPLVIVIAGASTYWYLLTAGICPAPLAYRIGEIDSNFAISEEQAKEYLARAEAVWENEANRDLFYYDENADIVVDFIFDDRQAHANSEIAQSERLDEKRESNENFFKQIETLENQYRDLSSSYENSVQDYERQLNEYNNRVSGYNDRGGAPSEVFAELQREERRLNTESSALSRRSTELNDLATNINQLAGEGNKLVEEYNRQVLTYNKEFGYSGEFTQGDFERGKINIYKFSDEAELISVLSHEFGHALGIGHVEDESSVMYYLLLDASADPVLSDNDKQALLTACGSGNEISHTIRRIIRNILSIF